MNDMCSAAQAAWCSQSTDSFLGNSGRVHGTLTVARLCRRVAQPKEAVPSQSLGGSRGSTVTCSDAYKAQSA